MMYCRQASSFQLLHELFKESTLTNVSVIDITYIYNNIESIFTWVNDIGVLFNTTILGYQLRLVILWVPILYFLDTVRFNYLTTLQRAILDY